MWYIYGTDIPFTPEEGLDAIGFVYLITRLDTGRKYIGQKKLARRLRKPPLKGKKRHRLVVSESDWMDYWSSNKTLQEEVKHLGEENFRRDILHLCKSKAELNYLELREQILADVLLKPDEYYNEYCGGRISRKQLAKFIQENQDAGESRKTSSLRRSSSANVPDRRCSRNGSTGGHRQRRSHQT